MAHICSWRHAYSFDNPLRHLFHKPECMFADYVKNGMTVADLGCGMGFFSIGMAKMIGDDGIVFSIDVQQQMAQEEFNRVAKIIMHCIRWCIGGIGQIWLVRCRPKMAGIKLSLGNGRSEYSGQLFVRCTLGLCHGQRES